MKRKVIQRPPSARQKMINLMYIVLLAMLAMNVSSDVLNGFKIVEESLSKSTTNATIQNEQAYRQFATADSINHEIRHTASLPPLIQSTTRRWVNGTARHST